MGLGKVPGKMVPLAQEPSVQGNHDNPVSGNHQTPPHCKTVEHDTYLILTTEREEGQGVNRNRHGALENELTSKAEL